MRDTRLKRRLAAIVAAILLISPAVPATATAAAERPAAARPAVTTTAAPQDDREGKDLGERAYQGERGKDLMRKRAEDGTLGDPDRNYAAVWAPLAIAPGLLPTFNELMRAHWGRTEDEKRVTVREARAAGDPKGLRKELRAELVRDTGVAANSSLLPMIGGNLPRGPHTELILMRGLAKAVYIQHALNTGVDIVAIHRALDGFDKRLDIEKAMRSPKEYKRIVQAGVEPNGPPAGRPARLPASGITDRQACGAASGTGCSEIAHSLDYAAGFTTSVERSTATSKIAGHLADEIARLLRSTTDPAERQRLMGLLDKVLKDLVRKAKQKLSSSKADEIAAERRDLLWEELRELQRRRYIRWAQGLDPYIDDLLRRQGDLLNWYTNRRREEQQAGRERLRARGLMGPRCDGGGVGCVRDPAPSSGLEQSLAAAANGRNGGIDLRSLELRYLSDRPGDGRSTVNYAFTGKPAKRYGDQHLSDGLDNAEQASDAFFVWLAMKPDTFWVNLSPDEPDRVIDAKLGRTDVGRVMLEADLRLKKTVGELIHPDTKTGKRFWKGMRGGCYTFRNWIVPGQADVYASGDELYIVDAPLKVMSEADYLKSEGFGKATPCRLGPADEEHNQALYKKLILPKLQRAVNEAKEYAQLRRVYLSRVAAEWYRQRDRQRDGLRKPGYGSLIDTNDIARWRYEGDWKPRDTFDAYVDSYSNGEFDIKRETRRGNWIYTRTYVFGGVNWTNLSFNSMDRAAFEKAEPGLAARIGKAFGGRSADPGGERVWVGASVPVRSNTRVTPPEKESSLGIPLTIVTVILVGAAVVIRRRMSLRSTPTPPAGD